MGKVRNLFFNLGKIQNTLINSVFRADYESLLKNNLQLHLHDENSNFKEISALNLIF